MNNGLPADERPWQRDDPKMRGVGPETVERPLHPEHGLCGSHDAERPLRIGR
jgi:hypothetical protein